jgi:hypothetical protein
VIVSIEMINHAYRLIRKYNLDNRENKTFVDGSSSGCGNIKDPLNVEDKLTALNTKNEVKLLDHLHLEVIMMKARHLSK